MKDPVVMDEARHDRECAAELKRLEAAIDEATAEIIGETEYGALDSDLLNNFDGVILMRIARIFATKDPKLAYSLTHGDLQDIRNGIEDYARDLAERRTR